MGSNTPVDVTGLLARWTAGDSDAERDLFQLVHPELRRMARRYAGRPGQTLQATAVVNEAYLRLVAQEGQRWQDRAHFFAVCAKAMRHIVVDHARARAAAKRGGGARAEPLDEQSAAAPDKAADVLALDAALERLHQDSPRRAQVVELRYFGGLTNDEIAEVLKTSPATVERDWRHARAWLYAALGGPEP
jgi:RNA polymerase sigma factor (TIGR02999 family)